MSLALSATGQQMSHLSGVRAIMQDIAATLATHQGKDFINLSAGNPVILPAIEQMWRDYTQELLASDDFGNVVCRYGSSQGYEPLIAAVVADFNQRFGLHLTAKNVLITAGSQSLYFCAMNAFAGHTADGRMKRVVMPLSPDYTGYGGMAIEADSLQAYRPALEINREQHHFKYRPDFSQLQINEDTGCVLFSRPCNPTGNVMSEADVRHIVAMAADHGVPVLIDSAYAPPFPALNFTAMNPVFADNVLHCISLSKAGLPGERVGIAIGHERYISVLQAFQANMCLHSSRYGQALAAKAIASGRLADLATTVIRPYYQAKFAIAETALHAAMPHAVPWYLHRGEGAIFAWLWLENLPISDNEFYEELKKVGVIVVPGNSFFPGLHEAWRHKHECLRISLTGSDEHIATAMERVAEVAAKTYSI